MSHERAMHRHPLLFALCATATCHALVVPAARQRTVVAEGAASTIDSGARIWDAGRLLSRLLIERELSGKRVLELGAACVGSNRRPARHLPARLPTRRLTSRPRACQCGG